MKCAIGLCGHCQFGPAVRLQGRAGVPLRPDRARCSACGSSEAMARASRKPRSSPSGSSPPATAASSSLLDCEDELLAVAGQVEIAYFLEASRATRQRSVRPVAGRGLDHDRRTTPSASSEVRRSRGMLVTIGACATAGGIQALRNFAGRARTFASVGLRAPRSTSTTAGTLDADRGARPRRLRAARLPGRQAPARSRSSAPSSHGRKPNMPDHSVCVECKRRGTRLRDGRARHALPRAR